MSILGSGNTNISEDRSVDKETMKTALLMELADMPSSTHGSTKKIIESVMKSLGAFRLASNILFLDNISR